MIAAEQVSAVLVTRGDVDLTAILATLPYENLVIWDNSAREDLRVLGRYAAMSEAENEVCYVQDDDHLFHNHEALLAAYEPGTILANMSEGWARNWDCHDHAFVGKGALVPRCLAVRALERYLEVHPDDELFQCWADPIVTVLSPTRRVDLGAEELPWGYAPNRMNTRPDFRNEKYRITDRARRIRDAR